jgi:crossover junction endodeoxyribonuclease RusA
MTGADHVVTLGLSWPAPALWANSRVHWAQRARAVNAARIEAGFVARAEGVGWLRTTTPRLAFAFHPPDARKRDLSNMPATMKAAIDGIADAMGCDDAGFRCVWPETWAEPVKGGAVVVQVSAPDWQHIGDLAHRVVATAQGVDR